MPSPRAMATIWCWSATPRPMPPASWTSPARLSLRLAQEQLVDGIHSRTAGPATGAEVHGDGTREIPQGRDTGKAGEGRSPSCPTRSTGIFWSRARRPPCSSPKQTCRFVPPMPWCSRTPTWLCPGSPTAGHHPAAGHGYPSERRHRGGRATGRGRWPSAPMRSSNPAWCWG